ncbi:2,3-dihydroxybenzoate--AMP ligase, partial [Bacillus cereus]
GFEQLDARIVDHIKRIHTVNGFSAVQTVEDTEKKRQKEEERKLNDLAEDYARESKEAFWNAHTYGRVDGVQKYVQGVNVGGNYCESARTNPASESGC